MTVQETNNFPEEETTSNTIGVIETLESGRIEEIETILGPVFRLPKAGVIRPGIKVLKSGYTTQDQKLYEELVAQGLDWDEIDQRLGKDANGKSKLIPQNVDYFTIRPEDCQNPQNVEAIHKLYADTDGKLRSFPVWFATNEWWNIIPHSLRCFGRQQGLKFTSFFKGSERWCKFPAPVTSKQKVFGGRAWGERPCEPNVCIEFQSGECKFGGVIQCYIPGTKGIGIWIIPTVSWHSLVSIKSSLEAFINLAGGRISGLFSLPGKDGEVTPQAIFRILKKKETVYTEGESGELKRHNQWIINLDIDFDLSEVVKWTTEQKITSRGHTATQILNGTPKDNPKTEPVIEKMETEIPEKSDTYQRLARALEESESLTELEANCFLIEESDEYQTLSTEMKNKLKTYADSLKARFKQIKAQEEQPPVAENAYRWCIQKLENSSSITELQSNYFQVRESDEFHRLSPDQQSRIKAYTNNLKRRLEKPAKEEQPF